jgi:hypothetical protein
VIKPGKAREPLAFLLLINPSFGSGFFMTERSLQQERAETGNRATLILSLSLEIRRNSRRQNDLNPYPLRHGLIVV